MFDHPPVTISFPKYGRVVWFWTIRGQLYFRLGDRVNINNLWIIVSNSQQYTAHRVVSTVTALEHSRWAKFKVWLRLDSRIFMSSNIHFRLLGNVCLIKIEIPKLILKFEKFYQKYFWIKDPDVFLKHSAFVDELLSW